VQRRAVLAGLSTGLATALAGCSSIGGVDPPELGNGSDATPTPTAVPRAYVADRAIAPAPSCSDTGPRGSASIEFDRRAGTVRVDGCIVAERTCSAVRLREASHDPDHDDLNVVIGARPEPEPGRECREEATPKGYVATVQFDPSLPARLSVRVHHRGARAGEITSAQL